MATKNKQSIVDWILNSIPKFEPAVKFGESVLYDLFHPESKGSPQEAEALNVIKRQATPTQIPTMTPTPTPVPPSRIPTPPPKVQEALNPEYQQFLEQSVFPTTKEYDIPNAVSASQWAMEGGRVMENAQNNLFGLMQGGKLIQYPSVEANVRDYALTVQNILKDKGYNTKEVQDAFKVLMALQEGDKPRYEAHNPDPYTYVENLINTPEFRSFYQ